MVMSTRDDLDRHAEAARERLADLERKAARLARRGADHRGRAAGIDADAQRAGRRERLTRLRIGGRGRRRRDGAAAEPEGQQRDRKVAARNARRR
jgi:hypothetical protein